MVTLVPSIPVNRSVRLPRLSRACCELVILVQFNSETGVGVDGETTERVSGATVPYIF